MKFIYGLFVELMVIGMKLFAFFNEKTRRGVEGRNQSLAKVKAAFTAEDKVIWMHAASLGEYDQGLPVLEALKKKFPKSKVLVTFFSPSGYDNVAKKNHPADVVCYLPFDRKSEVEEFLKAFTPQLFFTVKYDYWYHLLNELHRQKVPVYVVSALFYREQYFFKAYGRDFVKQLQETVNRFFHQTEESLKLAASIGLTNGIVTGDTRFDRVKEYRHRDNTVDHISDFKGKEKLIVFGSSWEAEEQIARELIERNVSAKIILAPHDLKRVKHLTDLFPDALLYSKIQEDNPAIASVLIIDSIGLLSTLYSYADIAVVGGGFHDAGLHNILEAATFGKPVLFGNHYKKNPEADALIRNGGAKSFSEPTGVAVFIEQLIDDATTLTEMSTASFEFVSDQPNATETIVREILA